MDRDKYLKAALKEALDKASFIKIDGEMFRVNNFVEDEGTWHFDYEDEDTGEVYCSTLEELEADMYEIELYKTVKSWSPERTE